MLQFNHEIYKKKDTTQIKAVFLDRDGTINEEVNYLSHLHQLRLLPHVTNAIRKLNENNFLVIIVTNQPVIAKGLATIAQVKFINDALVSLLNKEGAIINGVYFCPHHPNANLVKYRLRCSCRKPELAMFERAIADFEVDVKTSFVIGDSTRDIKAGKDLGVKTFLLKTGYGGSDKSYSVTPDYTCNTLEDAVDIILKS